MQLGYVAPAILGVFAITFFYIANTYRGKDTIGWFELYFNAANIFLLAGVFILFSILQTDGQFTGIAASVLGIFQGLLGVYVLIIGFMVLKFLKHLFGVVVNKMQMNL